MSKEPSDEDLRKKPYEGPRAARFAVDKLIMLLHGAMQVMILIGRLFFRLGGWIMSKKPSDEDLRKKPYEGLRAARFAVNNLIMLLDGAMEVMILQDKGVRSVDPNDWRIDMARRGRELRAEAEKFLANDPEYRDVNRSNVKDRLDEEQRYAERFDKKEGHNEPGGMGHEDIPIDMNKTDPGRKKICNGKYRIKDDTRRFTVFSEKVEGVERGVVGVGTRKKPEWDLLRADQLVSKAKAIVKGRPWHVKAKQRERFSLHILRAHGWVQGFGRRSGFEDDRPEYEGPLDEAGRVPVPVVLGRVQGEIEKYCLTIAANCPDLVPWGSRLNLLPRGQDLQEQHKDYLDVRAGVRGCRVRIYKLLGKDVGEDPIPESVRLPEESAIFPVADADWEDLTITFGIHGSCDIKVKFECKGQRKTFDLEDVGFRQEGKTGAINAGAVLLYYARLWAKENGRKLTPEMIEKVIQKNGKGKMSTEAMKTNVSRIRDLLKRITGLNDDPFKAGGGPKKGGWELRCTLKCDDSDYAPGNDAMRGNRVDRGPRTESESDLAEADFQGDRIDRARSKDGRTAIRRNPDKMNY
ncbi:MAG: hypothetical protein ABIH23_16310 [bacterium]